MLLLLAGKNLANRYALALVFCTLGVVTRSSASPSRVRWSVMKVRKRESGQKVIFVGQHVCIIGEAEDADVVPVCFGCFCWRRRRVGVPGMVVLLLLFAVLL